MTDNDGAPRQRGQSVEARRLLSGSLAVVGETAEVGGEPSPIVTRGALGDVAVVARYVLAVSYPVLAVSTGARALYGLFLKHGAQWSIGPALSLLAAMLYLGATIGFAVRRRWAWWTSVALLGVETVLTLVVGTITLLDPGLVGSTVWRLYGADYGFFPLVQPLLGLIWLLWPDTMRAYGVQMPHGPAPHQQT